MAETTTVNGDVILGDAYRGRTTVTLPESGQPPKYIVKAKSGRYHYYLTQPTVASNFQWYMSNPREVDRAEFIRELQLPNRRWYATDKETYDMTVEYKCSVKEGEPYACLKTVNGKGTFWVGPRHEQLPPEEAVIILSVADLYLKSQAHQLRMFRQIVSAVRRVTGNLNVFRSGNTMIEIRKEMPTPEQMHILTLLPGIAKLYKALKKVDGEDPRGDVLAEGAGGMPILTDQPALCLISGGIDSPVAAYKMMQRGCHVSGVHFLNSTNDTAAVMEKNRTIGKLLSRVQGKFVMHFVDISKLQSQIVANVPNHNRTLTYKWFMLSLAAALDDAKFIVVGDSLGQVASQTIHNISTLYSTIRKAVIAPLIGTHKQDIVDVANRIDTFNVSIVQAADCCQFMMCKTGANLFIGKRALRACVSRVKMCELPMETEIYFNGELVDRKSGFFTPEMGARDTDTFAPAQAHGEEEAHNLVTFDSAAGTTVHSGVQNAVNHAPHANPNSLHQGGRAARMAIEKVRSEFAAYLGVSANDLVFTSGGTESNAIALNGYRVVRREAWTHASTVGATFPEDDQTAPLVQVTDLVNHETGSINEVRSRAAPTAEGRPVRLHVDACQALTKIDLKKYVDFSVVDTMAFTAHKMNGPVGCGILYVKDLANQLASGALKPLTVGGSQEQKVRPGTENVPAIVGFGVALRLDRSASAHKDIEQYVVQEVTKLGLTVNKRGETSGFIVHATLPEGIDNVDVVSMMSVSHNVEVGTGSACKTNQVNNGVYETLGVVPVPVKRSLRFSWDSFATMEEAEYAMGALKKTLIALKHR